MKHLALVAYESRFARCGGVTAVLNYLPGSLAAATGMPTCVITPYHLHIRETTSLSPQTIGTVRAPFAGGEVIVRVRRHQERWAWIFIDAQDFVLPAADRHGVSDLHFFAGRRHPYDVGRGADDQLAILRRDALFFGAAVARALTVIAPDAQWTLLLQDWQAATTALALAASSVPARAFLTLHNSYDSGGIWPPDLVQVGIDPDKVPGADGSEAATALNRVFPRVGRPIFTVSQQFALDFTEDVFQREVMANQLQHALRPPNLLGVNNGPFASRAIPEAALTAARKRNYDALHAWKLGQKRSAIEALSHLQANAERPVWGDVQQFTATAAELDLPWFVLAGRDDARQKGYDLAAAAVQELLADTQPAGTAQFLFFPMPGDEGRPGLAFLRDLAELHPARVLVLPFLFLEGYVAALQGAQFGVMPSFYEPFGMANEFYLNGAVGVGRATGGLVQQIVPARTAASFTAAVQNRADRWHAADAPATGFLFREPDDLPVVAQDWRAFNAVGYVVGGHPNRVEERSGYRLFQEMKSSLRQAFADALELYRRSPDHADYYAMLVEGVGYIERSLSWDAAAKEYQRYIS